MCQANESTQRRTHLYAGAMKYSSRWWTWREDLDWYWHRFKLCTVKRQHQEKMDSHGHCYRCGKFLR